MFVLDRLQDVTIDGAGEIEWIDCDGTVLLDMMGSFREGLFVNVKRSAVN